MSMKGKYNTTDLNAGETFQPNDPVVHMTHGRGIVTDVKGKFVKVRFTNRVAGGDKTNSLTVGAGSCKRHIITK